MSKNSRMVIAWALVCGLLTLLAAHPFLFERNDALAWVLGGLITISIMVAGVECIARIVRQRRHPFARSSWHQWHATPPGLTLVWRRHLLAVSMAAFTAGVVLSFSVNEHASLSGLLPAAFGLVSLGLGRVLGTDERAISLLACTAVGSGSVVACYAVCQYLGFDPLPAATAFTDRTVAVFGNPNHLGSFMAALLPIVLGGFLLSSRLRFHVVWYPVTALLHAALLLAGSRGAWVGCLAGLAVLVWTAAIQMRRSGGRWHRGRILAMVATLAAVTLWLGPTRVMENERGVVTVGQRILSTAYAAAPGAAGDPTLSHRYFLWHVAWQLILDRPIVGIGLDRFADSAAGATLWERYGTWHAHNEYLNYWAEGGLLTLVGFLGMVVSAFRRSRRHGLGHAAASGAVASVLVHGLVSYPLHMPVTAILFWVLLGIIITEEDASSSSRDSY